MTFAFGNNVGKPQQEEVKPTITSNDFQHELLDSTYVSHTSLYANVPGTPVLTFYHRQYGKRDTEQLELQFNDINTYQSYTLIKRLIIKFQGKPSFTFDPQTGESTESVTAWVLMDVVPLLYDFFVADIGDGKMGLYQISAPPEYRTKASDKVYQIEVKLRGYLTQAIQDNINQKIVETFVYSKESALSGGRAIITEEDADLDKRLFDWLLRITDYTMREFYYYPEETLALKPSEDAQAELYARGRTYDPYLIDFLSKVLPLRLTGLTLRINKISTQGVSDWNRIQPFTVWDAFLKNNFDILKLIKRHMWIIDRASFRTSRGYGTIFNSKFNWVVANNPEDFEKVPLLQYERDFYFVVPPNEPERTAYCFTDGFYDGEPGNDFEKLIYRSFVEKITDKREVLAQCEKFYELDPFYQLYYSGIYVMLINRARINTGGFL